MENSIRFSSLTFLQITFSLFCLIPFGLAAQISSINDALSAIRDGEDDTPQIPHIYFSISSLNGTSDECVLAFIDEATSQYEWTYDALKMESFNPMAIEMALVTSDANLLTVDARPYIAAGFSVPLFLDIPAAGTYLFLIGDVVNLNLASCLYVEDLATGNIIPAVSGQTLSIVSNTAYSGNRLLLHASPILSITASNITCGNSDNGVIDIIVPGLGVSYNLTAPNSQTIASGNQSQTIINLSEGHYQMQLIYADNQCPSQSQSLVIGNPDAMSAKLTWHRVDHCNTDSNGAVLLENNSGSDLNYTITNSNEIISSSGILSPGPNLIEGLYADHYTIITAGACPLNTTINLNDPEAIPAIGYEAIPANCSVLNSGQITVFESEENYHFNLLNNVQEIIFSGTSGNTISELVSGNYVLSAFKSSLVCPAVSVDIEILPHEPLSANIAELQVVHCNEGNNGSFEITTNALSGFDYSIINTAGGQIQNGHSDNALALFHSLTAGVYSIQVNTQCGSTELSVNLNDPLSLSTQILGGDVTINLSSGQSEALYVEHDGSSESSYHWNLSNGFEITESTFVYEFNTAGSFILILENNNGHCISTDTVYIQVNQVTSLSEEKIQSPVTLIQTADDITFSFHGESAEVSNVSIIDMTGKTIWGAAVTSGGGRKITASVNQFRPGTYIALCHSSSKIMMKSKFVIR